MPQDFQKQEAKNCLWEQEGQHTGKRWRNRGKGRGKDRREIAAQLKEQLGIDRLDLDDMLNEEANIASYCHFHGPCSKCQEYEHRIAGAYHERV